MSKQKIKKKKISSQKEESKEEVKGDLKEETPGLPKDVDFKKFLGCGG